MRTAKVAIADRDGLARIIRRAAERHGGLDALAEAAGVDRSTLSRLVNRRHGRMALDTFRGFAAALPVDDLFSAVLLPTGVDALGMYNEWISDQLERVDRERCERVYREIGEGFPHREDATGRVLHGRYRKMFEDFLTTLRQTHRSPTRGGGVPAYLADLNPRGRLAFYRVLEPLATEGGGIELDWYELHEREALERYLSAAITRETILLDRDNDMTRAKQIGELLEGGLEYDEFAETIRRAGLGELPPMDEGD